MVGLAELPVTVLTEARSFAQRSSGVLSNVRDHHERKQALQDCRVMFAGLKDCLESYMVVTIA